MIDDTITGNPPPNKPVRMVLRLGNRSIEAEVTSWEMRYSNHTGQLRTMIFDGWEVPDGERTVSVTIEQEGKG